MTDLWNSFCRSIILIDRFSWLLPQHSRAQHFPSSSKLSSRQLSWNARGFSRICSCPILSCCFRMLDYSFVSISGARLPVPGFRVFKSWLLVLPAPDLLELQVLDLFPGLFASVDLKSSDKERVISMDPTSLS